MFSFIFKNNYKFYFVINLFYYSVFSLSFENYNFSFDTSSKMCYVVSKDALKFSGSATPYKFVGNLSTKQFQFPGCIPVKIWLLIRHGSRTPSKSNINFMRTVLPAIRHHILYNHMIGKGELSEETINMFKDWSMVIPKKPKLLTEYGKKEMFDLAERYQKRFPELLPDIYSTIHYQFRHTISDRTKLSAYNYALGLFGSNETNRLTFPDSFDDRFVLKFHKYCRKWKKHVKNNPEKFIEHFEFLIGEEVEQLSFDVTHRLGLNETLTFDEISIMFKTCASEFAWNNKDSPWCHIFSLKDLEVLEYESDLKRYYRDSYGDKINYKQACPLIKDMLDYLTNGSSWPQAVLSFSHSGTMIKFFSALNLYRDNEPLTSELNLQRKWKLSTVDSFSSNFGTILYRCHNYNEDKVLVLHQETPVILPGCPENDLCPLSILERNYNYTRNNCNFDKICGNKRETPSKTETSFDDVIEKLLSLL
ncbi:multiple inositol polyphosphate phosphatase 1-like [Lycorma delicatula]|uniref:multiple inositol polyphosphate phosphatase 1-like n=1 Tax=Lycorma delicatula TaxID=130591 RepID=UPI003F50FA9B